MKRVPATAAGTVGVCDDTSGPSGCKTFESTASVASVGNDLLSFCNDLGVTAEDFFTEEVLGKKTLINIFEFRFLGGDRVGKRKNEIVSF